MHHLYLRPNQLTHTRNNTAKKIFKKSNTFLFQIDLNEGKIMKFLKLIILFI